MKVKTSDLTGAALDWAVAKCEGFQLRADPMDFGMKSANGGWWIWEDASRGGKQARIGNGYSPSTNWSQAGPIIENSAIAVRPSRWIGPTLEVLMWEASPPMFDAEKRKFGPTLLIAAMRCYVASKLGEEVEVPDELA